MAEACANLFFDIVQYITMYSNVKCYFSQSRLGDCNRAVGVVSIFPKWDALFLTRHCHVETPCYTYNYKPCHDLPVPNLSPAARNRV